MSFERLHRRLAAINAQPPIDHEHAMYLATIRRETIAAIERDEARPSRGQCRPSRGQCRSGKAALDAAQAHNQVKNSSRAVQAYKCQMCGRWHVGTSGRKWGRPVQRRPA